MEKIDLQGANNVRDFGNTVNREGKRIKPRCFIRSNALNGLSTRDIEKLKHEYNLKTVIDLRTQTEIEEKPDKPIFGVNYIHIPVIEESAAGISHEKEIDKKEIFNNLPDMRTMYRSIVADSYSVSQLKKVFRIIADNDDGAILWHCTEGKDRCGLTSALFLSLFDVDRTVIYSDYLMTNNASSKNAKKYYFLALLITKSIKKAEQVRRIFRAEREYLDAAFAAIDEEYGGVDAFLKNQLGITDELKSNLKSKYLE